MAKYRLLIGTHSTGQGRNKIRYQAGDVIESDTDLVATFNREKSEKFEKVSEGSISDTFDAMTLAELKQFAEAEEIDLGTATRRQQIITTLREAKQVV